MKTSILLSVFVVSAGLAQLARAQANGRANFAPDDEAVRRILAAMSEPHLRTAYLALRFSR